MTTPHFKFKFNQRVFCQTYSGEFYGTVIGIGKPNDMLIILLDVPMADGRTGITLHETEAHAFTMDMALSDREKQMIHDKDMLGALKSLRRRTHCSLHDAKDAVEHYRDKRRSNP